MMNYGNGGFMNGGMLLWMLFGIVLLALGIWAVIYWMKRSSIQTAPDGPVTNHPSALEVLQQRYAHGEIDTPTFEQMREQLQAHQEHPTAYRS